MRGLSNFYSDSKKRIRTSYQSKSGLPKGWGTLCLCAGVGWGGGGGNVLVDHTKTSDGCHRDWEGMMWTESKGTKQRDDWNESGCFI